MHYIPVDLIPERAARYTGETPGWPPGVFWTVSRRMGRMVICDARRLPTTPVRYAQRNPPAHVFPPPPAPRGEVALLERMMYPMNEDHTVLLAMAQREMIAGEEWYWRDRLLDEWVDAWVDLLDLFRMHRPPPSVPVDLDLAAGLTAEEESLLELTPAASPVEEDTTFSFAEKKPGPSGSILDQFMWMYTS